MRFQLALAAATLLAATVIGGAAVAAEPDIQTDDVALFYRVYDAAGGHPTAEQLDRDYIAKGSDALRQFAEVRRVSGASMVAMMEKRPEIYVNARRCMSVLPAVKQRLTVALNKLSKLYPEAKSAPIALEIGRGKPVGVTSSRGVYMGVEALCAADFMDPNLENRFVHNIAHEYGHVQQPRADDTDAPGATVLLASLIEGGAEFTAELISGGVGDYQFKTLTKGREAQIETAFVRDEDKTDLSHWLYNGGLGTPEHPGDLGYWVGYRIVKSYYHHTTDKHQALKDIFEMKDPKAFVAKSGWRPGMQE